MKKRVFYTEAAYLLGLLLLALGTALMETADFGVSMVVAPAYLVYRRLNPVLPFFSFGMAEYLLQFTLLLAMMLILRRARLSYLFSFVTAVIYGLLLDGCMALAALLPAGLACRVACYVMGLLGCAAGVSMLFRTYISPEVYELFVKEVSARAGMALPKFKTIYDCVSCLIAVLLSFAFFGWGEFVGVKLGTVLCALVNGWIIGRFSALWDTRFEFRDALRLRGLFEGDSD